MTKPVSDIVERLRHEADQWHPSEKSPIRELREAADEIERLRRTPPEDGVVEVPSGSNDSLEAAIRDARWFLDNPLPDKRARFAAKHRYLHTERFARAAIEAYERARKE